MRRERYELRMCPDKVEALKSLARKLAYERGSKCSWSDLAREGADLILLTHGVEVPTVTQNTGLMVGGAR